MSFVPVKSEEQQAGAMLLTVREGLVKQRTMVINAIPVAMPPSSGWSPQKGLAG